MERLFARAFNRLAGAADAASQEQETAQAPQTIADAGPKAVDTSGSSLQQDLPSTSASAVSAVLSAWRAKDYFKLLQLPPPTADALGRPVWQCSREDVARAYRRLSVLVHPDKVPGEEARQAFEALNEASRLLKGGGEYEGRLQEVLKEAAGRAALEAAAAEAALASSDQRAAAAGSRLSKTRELRKEEGRAFGDAIIAQARKRQEEAARKRAALAAAANRERGSPADAGDASDREQHTDEQPGGGSRGLRTAGRSAAGDKRAGPDSDDDEGGVNRNILSKRKKPSFI